MTEHHGHGAGDAPWLMIDPTVERALLVALLRRQGGFLKLQVDELMQTSDITWGLEGFRSPDEPDVVHFRLRRLDQ